MTKQLIKRAVALFPRADYLPVSAVRHNRRRYLESVEYLRSRQIWILDQKVQRVQ